MATTEVYGSGDSYRKSTELAVFIPEIWTDSIRATFKQKLKLGALATDYSSLVSGGGDKIHIPTMQDVGNAAELTEGNAVDYASPTEVELTIEPTDHYYTSAMIQDLAVVQSSQELFSGYADSMAYKLALRIEVALQAKLAANVNGIDIAAGASASLDKDALHTVITELYAENVNPEECTLILTNGLYASLFKADDFIHISKTGISNYGSGVVGTVMGMNVIQCPQINGTTAVPAALVNQAGSAVADDVVIGGYVVHNSALGIAYSKRPTMNSEYDMDYIAHKMVADMVYGCELLQDTNQKKVFTLFETGNTSQL